MNVLFVLYGDFSSNSAIPLMLHARELTRRGHRCAVALPSGAEAATPQAGSDIRVVDFATALEAPDALFPDGQPANMLHAWTPRESVRRFVSAYLANQPCPWVIYLEDNEGWIARAALAMAGIPEPVLLRHSDEVISTWTPEQLSHVLRYEAFIGLADAAAVVQPKLCADVPPWINCATVMPGTDLELFRPREPDASFRARFELPPGARVIVYPGGLNDFTRPGLKALCEAVGLINRRGTRCLLVRSGPVALDFLDRLPADAREAIRDVGVLPRSAMADLLALADLFVQPGNEDRFEELRLPGKLPELFAMGRPVVLPRIGIADLLRDGVDAVFHDGTADDIAEKCHALLADPARARGIGDAGRRFAEAHFDPKMQAARLEAVYEQARAAYDAEGARAVWSGDVERLPVAAILAKRLRRLAERGGAPQAAPEMLRAHAACIEFGMERARALEIGMAWRDGEIARRDGEITKRDNDIAQRDAEIARRGGEIARIEGELGATQAEVDHLTAAIARSTEHLTQLRADAAALRTRISALEQTISARERHIAALESSLSWRLTHPLRRVAAWLGWTPRKP